MPEQQLDLLAGTGIGAEPSAALAFSGGMLLHPSLTTTP
jgi:hypothetical protein